MDLTAAIVGGGYAVQLAGVTLIGWTDLALRQHSEHGRLYASVEQVVEQYEVRIYSRSGMAADRLICAGRTDGLKKLMRLKAANASGISGGCTISRFSENCCWIVMELVGIVPQSRW